MRSVRRGGKVVQETVAHLGELDARGARARRRRWRAQITGRGEQRELFEATATQGQTDRGATASASALERSAAFGDVWLGWTLWRALRLDELCAELLPRGARRCRGR